MKLVTIESPLAGDFKRNQRYARLCCLDCLQRGEAPYASHLFYTQMLDDRSPPDRELGITAGFDWAAKADLVAFYCDLGVSGGMHRAAKHWGDKSSENRFLPKHLLDLLDTDAPLTATPGGV